MTTQDTPQTFTLEIKGYAAEQIMEAALGGFWTDRRREKLESRIEQELRDVVKVQVATLAIDMLRPVVEQVVKDGWPSTNNYGETVGKHTVESLVRDQLIGRPGDNWGRNVFKDTLDRMIKEEINKQLKPMVAEAEQQMRKLIDEASLLKLRDLLSKIGA